MVGGMSLFFLPESRILQVVNVVNDIVAIAGHAGHLIGFDPCHHIWRLVVMRFLFECSRGEMAVEALTIIVWRIEIDLVGLRNHSEIFDINVMQASKFCMKGTEQSVVRMAGVTGVVSGHEVVLKVAGGNEGGIVHIKLV